VERPRLSWLEDGENDLRELKMKRWRQMVNNGKQGAWAVKEAKVKRVVQRRSNRANFH
jgi:hypothetical protein